MARTVFLALVLALSALATSCGGEDQSATEQWADEVCTSVGDWSDELRQIADGLTEKGVSVTSEDIRSATDDAAEATRDLVESLRDAGQPDTEAGQEAKAALDELATSLEARVERIRDAADATGGAGARVQSLGQVAGEIQGAVTDVRATTQGLGELDRGGELEAAFRDTDSCQELREEDSD